MMKEQKSTEVLKLKQWKYQQQQHRSNLEGSEAGFGFASDNGRV